MRAFKHTPNQISAYLMELIQKIAVLFIVKPFFKLFFKFKSRGVEHIKGLSGPVLIIGNHKFSLDSFALGAALPLSAKLFPIKFMGITHGFSHPALKFLKKIRIIKLVYCLFGVFPVIRGQGLETALKTPIEIFKGDGVVFMHPEGRVNYEDNIAQFKRGAPALALITKVKVLPVVFKIKRKGFRGEYFVKFGQAFHLPENLTYEQGADYMREVIVGLYKG